MSPSGNRRQTCPRARSPDDLGRRRDVETHPGQFLGQLPEPARGRRVFRGRDRPNHGRVALHLVPAVRPDELTALARPDRWRRTTRAGPPSRRSAPTAGCRWCCRRTSPDRSGRTSAGWWRSTRGARAGCGSGCPRPAAAGPVPARTARSRTSTGRRTTTASSRPRRSGRRNESCPRRCSDELTVTTRGSAAAARMSSSSPVSAKWPRWLPANWISCPCGLSDRGGIITPALLTSTSTACPSACSPSANARTESRSARSSALTSRRAPGWSASSSSRACLPLRLVAYGHDHLRAVARPAPWWPPDRGRCWPR